MESERLELESRPFSLRDAVEDSFDLVAPAAAARGLDLSFRIENSVPSTLEGDVTRVRQILLNLLSNAVKFTPCGEIVLRASSQPAANGKRKVEIVVRDTGIGIPKERLDRLFESFSQVDPSTTRRFGGTGLGLAICKGLAERMGGGISVSSEPSRGSTFRVTLVAPEGPPPTISEAMPGVGRLVGQRVLLVDDAPGSRETLAETLCVVGDGRPRNGLPAGSALLDRGARAVRRRPPGRGDVGARRPPPGGGDPADPRHRRAPAPSHHLPRTAGRRDARILRRHPGPARPASLPRLRPGRAARRQRQPAAPQGGRTDAPERPGEDAPAADPPRRGQRREPEGRALLPFPDGLRRRPRQDRPRGPRGGPSRELRRRPDGRPDAGDGRLRGDPAHPGARPRREGPLDRRPDGQRDDRRPGEVLRGRDERLPFEAGPGRGPGGGPAKGPAEEPGIRRRRRSSPSSSRDPSRR